MSVVIQPGVSIAITNADQDVSNFDQKVLLVGQITSAGSATSGVLVENISSTGAPENALFGRDSQLAEMVRAFKRVNPLVQLDAIPLDDAAGTAREVDFVVVGTATAAGSITVVAGSEVNYSFDVAIANGDTETDVADAIVAALNADLNLPFTASNVAGAVTLTAINLGAVANDLGVELGIDSLPAGITVPAGVVLTTPGATDPTLTGVLDVATSRYQGVVWPYSDSSVLRAWLAPRFNPDNQILDGVGFISIVDTHSNALTALGLLNDQNVVYFVDKVESETQYKGPAQNEASYVKSAYFAAVRSLRLTDGASISRFLTTGASRDVFGGTALASLPYFNTILPDLPLITTGRGWTAIEIEQLQDAGGSVMGVNSAGNTALVGEVVTTYKTDGAGNPDVTFKFLNYVDTSSNAREYNFNNLKSRFGQSRLTQGAVSSGRDMANDTIIRAYCEKLFQDLGGADFVLVQSGDDARSFFKANLDVTLDLSLGKVTIVAVVPIVTQLRQITMTMRIAFDATS